MSKNIIVSSWPSAGGSTMAMMLANLLGYKYVYAGWALKTLAKELFGADSGNPHLQFENTYGEAWDHIWETYAKWILGNQHQMLLEGMTAGFLYGDNTNFSIYYTASVDARAARSEIDQRLDAAETIRRRDIEVRQRWIDLLGIDVYDAKLMQSKYDLIVDGSDLTVSESLQYTIEQLSKEGFNIQISHQQITEMENTYWREGKQYYHQALAKQGLLWDPQHVFADWYKYFPELVEELPVPMRDIVLKLK